MGDKGKKDKDKSRKQKAKNRNKRQERNGRRSPKEPLDKKYGEVSASPARSTSWYPREHWTGSSSYWLGGALEVCCEYKPESFSWSTCRRRLWNPNSWMPEIQLRILWEQRFVWEVCLYTWGRNVPTSAKVMEKAVRQASPFGMKLRESVVVISLISSSNIPTI